MKKHKIPYGFLPVLFIATILSWSFAFVLPWLAPFIVAAFTVLLVKIWKEQIKIEPECKAGCA